MGLSETVSSVKKKVEKELDVPCELQRLVFKGSPLTGNMISNVKHSCIGKKPVFQNELISKITSVMGCIR